MTTKRCIAYKGKPPIPGGPLLSPALLLQALRRTGSGEKSGNLRLFSHARYALATFLRERDAGNGTLYVPSYICEDAVAPLRPLGQKVQYYPVTKSLEPDWEWLDSRVEGSGDALLLVHYFGFPNAPDLAQEFCRSHGLALIEDCAHSFLTRYQDKVIGTFGDAGFYSFRKLLPIPDGAALVNNGANQEDVSHNDGIEFQRTNWVHILMQLLKFGVYQSRSASTLLRRLRAGGQIPGQSMLVPQPPGSADHKISRISYQLMQALEPQYENMSVQRHQNYAYLLDAFPDSLEAAFLYPDLRVGTCPYAFPIRLSDRQSVMHRLQASGVPVHPWPDLPLEVRGNPDFPMANRLADQVMLLPVHQGLNFNHLQRVVDLYRKVTKA